MKNTTSTQPTNKLLAQLTQRELKTLRRNFDENDFLINQGKNTIDFEPVVKFFNPTGLGTWYLTELSPDNIGFGICSLEYSELGYVSLNEVNNLKLPYGLIIEKDITFSAKGLTLSKFIEELREKDYKSFNSSTFTPDNDEHECLEEKAKILVNQHIFTEQTHLVETFLEKREFSYAHVLYMPTDYDLEGQTLSDSFFKGIKENEGFKQIYHKKIKSIYSWYCVSAWLFDKLIKKREVLLENEYGIWWGRETFGQPIMQDRVIQEIAQECF